MKVPVVPQIVEESLSYAESLARDLFTIRCTMSVIKLHVLKYGID